MANNASGYEAYQRQKILTATPAELTLMLYDGAIKFLNIAIMAIEKKERLITDEASSNNELINLNLQSFLAPRQEAARQFNELFGLTGTDKEISVRVRSDLFNIIKTELSSVKEFDNDNDGLLEKEELEEREETE